MFQHHSTHTVHYNRKRVISSEPHHYLPSNSLRSVFIHRYRDRVYKKRSYNRWCNVSKMSVCEEMCCKGAFCGTSIFTNIHLGTYMKHDLDSSQRDLQESIIKIKNGKETLRKTVSQFYHTHTVSIRTNSVITIETQTQLP